MTLQAQSNAPLGERAFQAAKLESRIAGVLSRTTDEVAHSESFDEDQRSEIYTILSMIDADLNGHRSIADALMNYRPAEA